jgi:hypothetical protein
MGSQLTTLTSSDIRRFERDGYVVVRQAFSRADGLAMERLWWRELEETHRIRSDDRSSWHQIRGDLKAAKRDPVQAKILTARVRGVLDDLLGQATWSPPRNWGRSLVTFPEPGACRPGTGTGTIPANRTSISREGCSSSASSARSPPQGGGTLILSGSPRLLIRRERQIPASQRHESGARIWERFHRSHPCLMALTGHAPSPADRIAAFMDRETTVEGVPLRVVELTGEAGDMVFCHPVIVHCVNPNRGTRPRFMRIKTQVLTHEGREPQSEWQRPHS